jgi:hypothetical protein
MGSTAHPSQEFPFRRGVSELPGRAPPQLVDWHRTGFGEWTVHGRKNCHGFAARPDIKPDKTECD